MEPLTHLSYGASRELPKMLHQQVFGVVASYAMLFSALALIFAFLIILVPILSGGIMSEEYRRHAAECLRIAESVTVAQQKVWLIDMAQAWLQLATKAEQNRIAETEPI